MPSITLLRNATLVVDLAGQRILVDPMLDPAGARPAIENTPAQRPNPLVELPAESEEALQGITAAIVTHLHADHLDDEGARFLAEAGVRVQGQAEQLDTLRERGLADVGEIGSAPFGDVLVQ